MIGIPTPTGPLRPLPLALFRPVERALARRHGRRDAAVPGVAGTGGPPDRFVAAARARALAREARLLARLRRHGTATLGRLLHAALALTEAAAEEAAAEATAAAAAPRADRMTPVPPASRGGWLTPEQADAFRRAEREQREQRDRLHRIRTERQRAAAEFLRTSTELSAEVRAGRAAAAATLAFTAELAAGYRHAWERRRLRLAARECRRAERRTRRRGTRPSPPPPAPGDPMTPIPMAAPMAAPPYADPVPPLDAAWGAGDGDPVAVLGPQPEALRLLAEAWTIVAGPPAAPAGSPDPPGPRRQDGSPAHGPVAA